MAGPWEKYKGAEAPTSGSKPWEKFQKVEPMKEEQSYTDMALKLLDYPARVTRTAIAAPLSENISATDVLEAAKTPLSPQKNVSGKDLLSLIKLPTLGVNPNFQGPKPPESVTALEAIGGKGDNIVKDIPGMGVEMATDPLQYGLLEKAGAGVSKGLQKLGLSSKEMAAERAVKSLGRMTPTQSEALGEAGKTALGKTLLENKIIGKIPATTKTLAQRVNNQLQVVGKNIGKIVEVMPENVSVAKNEIIDAVMKADDLPYIDPEFQKKAFGILEQFNTVGGEGPLSIKNAKAYQERLGKIIDWKKIKLGEISDRDKVLVKIYEGLSDGILNSAEALAKTDPQYAGLAQDIVKNRDLYSKYKTASKILNKQLAKEGVNRTISLTDYIAGAGGMAAGGVPGLAAAGLNKLVREFGSQGAAIVGQTAGETLPKIASGVEASTKGKLAPSLLRFLQTLNSDQGGK